MDRRCFLVTSAAGVLAAVAPRPAGGAQQASRLHRVGWLTTAPHPFLSSFREGMRDLGYLEGQNLRIEERYAAGRAERLPALLAELVRLKVDVLLTSGGGATRAANTSATAVPVVFVTGDPVGDGFVTSLSRPGGHMTGLALVNTEVGAKWVELVRALFPAATRVAVLRDPNASLAQARTVETAVRSLRLELHTADAQDREEIDRAFQQLVSDRVDAIIPISSATFAVEKNRIVALAARHRIPVVYEHRDFVEAGGLISYGPDLREVFRRAAVYVDRIIKGAKPAELPVEQPSKFELVINVKTAKTLGVTIPRSLLLRADHVIE